LEDKKMSRREAILGRIREALTVPAPVPGAHGSPVHSVSEPEAAARIADWLPAVEPGTEAHVKLFAANSADLKTDFRLFDSRGEMLAGLRAIAAAEGWGKIGTHRTALTDAAVEALGLPACNTAGGYDVHDLESCDAGISECDALVAQTGSVLVSSRSAGGRALSVLPPHHVVLASRGQILPDLPSAIVLLKAKYKPDFPSFFSFITGPSRTGDIERILVLGAHGPKKLTVLCYGEECPSPRS
jgi:L-lactate dehydrogenase complex protein LldG